MKTLFSFLLMVVLASGCAEKEIAPQTSTPNVESDDPQPPKSNCTGLPNCH